MPIDVEERAQDLAEKMANFVYFDCDTLHDGPDSLDATYVRYTAEILALVRSAVADERAVWQGILTDALLVSAKQRNESVDMLARELAEANAAYREQRAGGAK